MTRDEFFQLPAAEPYCIETRMLDGRKVQFPKERSIGVAWVGDDEPVGFFDDEGAEWRVVQMDGKRARQRVAK